MTDQIDIDAAEDVLPEAEQYYGDDPSLESAMYQRELNRKLQEQAELRAACIENGEDARKFLASRFGQYLLGQADLEADKARYGLEHVDPDDAKAIRTLQNIIQRDNSLREWIMNAIEAGDAEYTEYLEEQQGGI